MFEIDFEKNNGLVPVIVQDYRTKKVLMLGYMDKKAFSKTFKSGKATYYSRSRKALWQKGQTSGHEQIVKEIRVDCDKDTILLKVEQKKAACHKGYETCFFLKVEGKGLKITESKIFEPEKVYEKWKKN